MRGNIYATTSLVVLFGITSALVALLIVGPLVAHGRPRMPGRTFAASLVYFAGIGLGFMLVQMALLQRFSIYLGHPTYTLSITLFSMILFAGIGSFLSDFVVLPHPRLERALPLLAAAILMTLLAVIGPATQATIGSPLPVRSAVVIALLGPLSLVLGGFFPTGLRLVGQLSSEATAWMWGINGAFSVLGSIVAVANLDLAGIRAEPSRRGRVYGLLTVPLAADGGGGGR